MHFVYILRRLKNIKWYIGQTSDLLERMKQHKRLHPNYKLVYYEAYENRQKAVAREKQLKYYGSAWRALKNRLQA